MNDFREEEIAQTLSFTLCLILGGKSNRKTSVEGKTISGRNSVRKRNTRAQKAAKKKVG